jgi:hypothetical protein
MKKEISLFKLLKLSQPKLASLKNILPRDFEKDDNA